MSIYAFFVAGSCNLFNDSKIRATKKFSRNFKRPFLFRPVAGSKTEQRGRKAHSHVCREILELCQIISDMGHYQAKYREKDEDYDEEESADPDALVIVRFGDLFQVRNFEK